MSEPSRYVSSSPQKLKISMYFPLIILISLMVANLNVITDFVRHTDVFYFDKKHLLVGGVSGFFTAIFLISITISYLKLKISIQKISTLNMTLELKIQELAEELKRKDYELSIIEEKLREQLDKTVLAQNELRQGRLLLNAAIDNSLGQMVLLTPDGKLIEANKTSLDLIEAVKETVVGRYYWDTPWWNHNPSLQENVREAISRAAVGALVRFETETPEVNGNIHIIDFSLKPVCNEQGNIIYLMYEGRDITGYRQLENQLLQQQKLDSIGLIAGGIAHDFNNLLTPILGYSEMICNKVSSEDPIYADSILIWDAANSASGLIKQLIDFSRRQELSPQHHDLNRIIASFSLILRSAIREDIEIRQILSTNNCLIAADRNQIEQILLNLAINSQSAINGTGMITIETGHFIFDNEFCNLHAGAMPGRYVLLAFGDTGSGIADSVLPHIFEPFFSTASAPQGKGLGLYSVYCIVKQHDGFMDVRSKANQGTIFYIYFPETESDFSDDVQPAETFGTIPRQSGTIILVEDNKIVMDMTKSLLENQGYTVFAFQRPEEALGFVSTASQAIDLLLSDVVMPVMNGLELYDKLERLTPDLRALFMSGYSSATVLQKSMSEVGINFIRKPFTTETLIKKVHEMIKPALDNRT